MRAQALVLLSLSTLPCQCESKSQKTKKHKNSLILVIFYLLLDLWSVFASGQVVVGGDDGYYLSSVEIFPPLSSNSCFIPDLPQPRIQHSLSLLSGGRLVVCGGLDLSPQGVSRTCIVWAPGSTSWTHLHTIRSYNWIFHTDDKLNSTADGGIPTWRGSHHLSPTPSCCLAAIIIQHSWMQRLCQVLWRGQVFIFFVTGGATFQLLHSAYKACGIPDKETIVMTGGSLHNYVTR